MMNASYYKVSLLVASCVSALFIRADYHIKDSRIEKHIGVLRNTNSRLEGILWGNWGSRPYEYYWVSKVVDVHNKRVIDLGCGLPSQYDWYKHVVNKLKPDYYAGIDGDGRVLKELIHASNFDILHMNMAELTFGDKEFDVAYCISTFEHIPYDVFIKAIQEAHRVLKDDGVLVLTLDEQWDSKWPITEHSGWNDLEQSLIKKQMVDTSRLSFGLPDFLRIIQDYFVPVDDVEIDHEAKIIRSADTGKILYQRKDKDSNILHSAAIYNSCVSYAVLKKAH